MNQTFLFMYRRHLHHWKISTKPNKLFGRREVAVSELFLSHLLFSIQWRVGPNHWCVGPILFNYIRWLLKPTTDVWGRASLLHQAESESRAPSPTLLTSHAVHLPSPGGPPASLSLPPPELQNPRAGLRWSFLHAAGMAGKRGGPAFLPALWNGSIWWRSRVIPPPDVSVAWWLAGLFGAGTGGDGQLEDGAKVGLPAMDLSLAFPQATTASVFPPSGETFILFFYPHSISLE